MIVKKFGIELHSVRDDDLETIRKHRNSNEIRSKMFFQNKISKQEQREWFDKIKSSNRELYFIIKSGSQSYGLIHGKNVDYENRSSEGGIFIWDQSEALIGPKASLIMAELTFNLFGFLKSYAEVRLDNPEQISYNKLMGYELQMNSDENNKAVLVLTKENFEKKMKKVFQKIMNHRNTAIQNNDLVLSQNELQKIEKIRTKYTYFFESYFK
jgi:hypothetical protein